MVDGFAVGPVSPKQPLGTWRRTARWRTLQSMWRRGRRRSVAVGAFAVVQGMSAVAGASEGDLDSTEATTDPVATSELDATSRGPSPRQWYGWQTLLVDAAAVGLMVVGQSTEFAPVGYTGVFTYFLGGPVVHGANGRDGAAAGSFALRLGAPFATGWLLAESDDGNPFAAAFGLLLGAGLAITLDASLLAWKPRPEESQLPWRPRVIVRGTEARVEILGSF